MGTCNGTKNMGEMAGTLWDIGSHVPPTCASNMCVLSHDGVALVL